MIPTTTTTTTTGTTSGTTSSTMSSTMSSTTSSTKTTHVLLDGPLGPLRLVGDGEHLTGVYFETHRHAPADLGTTTALQDADPVLQSAAEQLTDYLAGRRTGFDLPVRVPGTEFQRRVWDALLLIPYGQTWSYGQLAARIGQAGAARAVGLANGRNPVSIVVPCHRVVGSAGAITGYGGGVGRKQALLDLERRVAGGSLF
ncbi:methylated-DNA--[protein]-cysteine S-methyltransferase [Ornithinimicrobium sp. W1665]|uniref:methylated-DNA--[protein]-cysteine S-methyltransferase n=1 Tax=Ornithinimicrobium sp. W1665 TaxID=3416666 RepID=UPI003CF5FCA1